MQRDAWLVGRVNLVATARTVNELASARCTYHADSAKHVISLGCECFAHGSITSASGTLAQVSVGNGCDCLVLQVPWQFHVKHWSALPFVWWLHNYKATFQWVYANCDEPTSIVLLLCSLLAGTICRFLILHACCWPCFCLPAACTGLPCYLCFLYLQLLCWIRYSFN